jgi:hypothetical protein
MRAPQHSLALTHRQTIRARAGFRLYRGPREEAERARAIARLPCIVWNGHKLYPLTCDADFGRGPHVQNVSEATLWALIDWSHFRCPYHR